MTWELEGRYVENCSCDVICPCTWSNLSRSVYDEETEQLSEGAGRRPPAVHP